MNHGLNDVVEGKKDGSDLYVTEFLTFEHPMGGAAKTGFFLGWANWIVEKAHIYLGIPGLTRLFHCKVDVKGSGDSECTSVASGFLGANGITITDDRQVLFVNDPIPAKISVYKRNSDAD